MTNLGHHAHYTFIRRVHHVLSNVSAKPACPSNSIHLRTLRGWMEYVDPETENRFYYRHELVPRAAEVRRLSSPEKNKVPYVSCGDALSGRTVHSCGLVVSYSNTRSDCIHGGIIQSSRTWVSQTSERILDCTCKSKARARRSPSQLASINLSLSWHAVGETHGIDIDIDGFHSSWNVTVMLSTEPAWLIRSMYGTVDHLGVCSRCHVANGTDR